MNRDADLPDSDHSDSDFCPEKEEVADVSEEASSEESGGSDENTTKVGERLTKNRKRAQTKQTKPKKRARAQKVAKLESNTDSDDEDSEPSTRRRSTRQTEGTTGANGRARVTQEKDELQSDEDEKSRTDALWADFLTDVKGQKTEKAAKQASEAATSSANVATSSRSVTTTATVNGASQSGRLSTETAPVEDKRKQVKVTEVLDFAGEEVRVEKVINADSIKENKLAKTPSGFKRTAALASGSSGVAGGSGGLGSILNQLGKKKKISVLEKSKLDWNSFKQDEGIEEELQSFNKGKDGFLERQDFLQRTDLRQFEIEKNLRQSRRN